MVKFKIEQASRLIEGLHDISDEMRNLIQSKGIPVLFLVLEDDVKISVVDILHLQNLLGVLMTVGKCVISMEGFPKQLPVITIYDSFIE